MTLRIIATNFTVLRDKQQTTEMTPVRRRRRSDAGARAPREPKNYNTIFRVGLTLPILLLVTFSPIFLLSKLKKILAALQNLPL